MNTKELEQKRQEIKEGIAKVIHQFTMEDEEWDDLLPEWKADFLKDAGKIAQFLHSQGVAIKVDKELPEGITSRIPLLGEILDELNFSATEPLIEEAESES